MINLESLHDEHGEKNVVGDWMMIDSEGTPHRHFERVDGQSNSVVRMIAKMPHVFQHFH